MSEARHPEVMWAGHYVTAMRDGRWEYVRRSRNISAVAILAETDSGEVILVEQYRVPLGRRCLELPAGLVGDAEEPDTPLLAAARELAEETGYRAAHIADLGSYYASPGMVSEGFTLVRATGLERIGEGGGVGAEEIVVHHVPRREVAGFVEQARASGIGIDVKLLVLLAGELLAEA